MNNNCQHVATLQDKELWNSYFDRLPSEQKDVHFLHSYYSVYEKGGYGEAICYIFEKDDNFVLYPFLKKGIKDAGLLDSNEEYYDIQGAYGFNGLASTTEDSSFFSDFLASFSAFCTQNNIVAEFTRFNPLVKNHIFSTYMNIIKANSYIVVDLLPDFDDLWMGSYEHSARKNVKRAEKNALEVVHFTGKDLDEHWLKAFTDIYYQTMKRNEADDFYFFPEEYFSTVAKNLAESALFYFVLKEKKVISCELVPVFSKKAYSFLGGTLADYFPQRPNDYLKHKIICHLKEIGVESYCLGGGLKEGDGMFKYKKSFSKNGSVDFYIGKKVHNQQVYNRLCEKWEEKNPEKKDQYKNYFLKYRIT